ncbi:hypothetical protein OkiPb01528_19600 [Escherichia coli]
MYTESHQLREDSVMATGSTNNKSQQLNARFPHDVVADLEKNLDEGESKAQFIVTAVKGEIKRRQRRKAKEQE